MENKKLFNNILSVVNRATPAECKIHRYTVFDNRYTNYINVVIHNFKNEWLELRTNRDEKGYTLFVTSNRGGKLQTYVSELEFLELKTAVLKCYERFDSALNTFCENFYD